MSELNLDDELIQEYLAECREHLATIETDLLAIEQSGAEIDEQLVNRVFRAAHSIKGGAGFFDLITIRELAHKTENVLDLIRSRKMVPTPEVVSIVLAGFDKLRELLQDFRQSNQADIAEFLDSLTALTHDHLSPAQKHSLTDKVEVCRTASGRAVAVAAFDLNQARGSGNCVYLIECDLIHDVQRRGKTPWQAFKRLIVFGTILDIFYDMNSAGTLDDEPSSRLILEMLYATPLTLDAIAGEIDLPAERIRLVEDNRTVTPVEAPAVEAVAIAAPVETVAIAAPAPPPTNEPSRPSAGSVEAVHKNIPAPSGNAPPAETTIRLNITLLDTLMTLAGELVLGRNQLNESVSRHDEPGIRSSAQRVSLVTSELQEVVALTRMQPVGSLFAKFQRLVRDLSRTLAKDVQLVLEGTEVEIDKSILEGLSDPLTHMVRNSVDHGIELPAERIAAGKTPGGTITLKASHQAGQVVIEITDDGKGLVVDKIAASSLAKGQITSEQLAAMSERDKMALIFLPGVSTAEKLSDVSGRGVGMDVVKTNLDRLGGKIEIDSVPGRGSRFRIKLPLTLAIIPSLLVSNGGERFAIPQVSVGELIRVPAQQIAERIDRVGDAEVLILRDRLVPLVYLADVIGVPRSTEAARAMNVVTVDTGAFEYGLVVQGLHETVEIVVKPLGRHMKNLHDYAGATVLGDGCVAVILDVAGLAARAGLSAASAEALSRKSAEETVASGELHSLLLFHNAPGEVCSVPIEQVSRIEHIKASEINQLGGRRTMIYRGASLPLVTLHDVAAVGELGDEQQWLVIVFENLGRPFGLLAAEPLDMIEATLEIDSVTLRQRGVAGSAVHKGQPLLLLDIFELVDEAPPEKSEARTPPATFSKAPGGVPTVLVADDSDFFRGQIQRLVESAGCRVLPAQDGQEAWEILNGHAAEVVLVATDVEMPRLDGLALTRKIRADHRFAKLPIIALSSLAGEEEIAHGLAAGVSEYQVKLNKDEFLASVHKAIGQDAGMLAA